MKLLLLFIAGIFAYQCSCKQNSCTNVPSDHQYYLTSFCDKSVSCGGGCGSCNWAYAADRGRFGCGAVIKCCQGSKCMNLKIIDAGPSCAVEGKAGRPVIDASPSACKYFTGHTSCGWSDHVSIHCTKVAKLGVNLALGPCNSVGPEDENYDASLPNCWDVASEDPSLMVEPHRFAWSEDALKEDAVDKVGMEEGEEEEEEYVPEEEEEEENVPEEEEEEEETEEEDQQVEEVEVSAEEEEEEEEEYNDDDEEEEEEEEYNDDDDDDDEWNDDDEDEDDEDVSFVQSNACNGKCQDDRKPCSGGHYVTGLCPGGTHIRCCTKSGGGGGGGGKCVSREAMIQRAMKWVKERVPYSQTKYHDGYRQDCSGLVNYAWQSGSSHSTHDMLGSVCKKITKGELKKGDCMLAPAHHTLLFDGWQSSDSFYQIAEHKPGDVCRRSPTSYSALVKQGFFPCRFNHVC